MMQRMSRLLVWLLALASPLAIAGCLNIGIRFSDGRGVVDAESEQPVTCGDTTLNRHAFDLDAGTYKLGYGSLYDPATLVLLMEGDTGHERCRACCAMRRARVGRIHKS